MSAFVELSVSIFDADFTLNPERYLEPLYAQPEVLGFQSEGMKFLFRFDQCAAVLRSPQCRREPFDSVAYGERELRYAECYPDRTWCLKNNFSFGREDMQTKVHLVRLIGRLRDEASFQPVQSTFRKLSLEPKLENYVSEIATIPLRVILETS